jgi:hypothetical protein
LAVLHDQPNRLRTAPRRTSPQFSTRFAFDEYRPTIEASMRRAGETSGRSTAGTAGQLFSNVGTPGRRVNRTPPRPAWRDDFVTASHFSLLTSHFSLLTTHFSLLTSHFSLLTSHFSLLATDRLHRRQPRRLQRGIRVSVVQMCGAHNSRPQSWTPGRAENCRGMPALRWCRTNFDPRGHLTMQPPVKEHDLPPCARFEGHELTRDDFGLRLRP